MKGSWIKSTLIPGPVGVRWVCATMGETMGEAASAGDDLSGKSGLALLQSRKQPVWMGLDEN